MKYAELGESKRKSRTKGYVLTEGLEELLVAIREIRDELIKTSFIIHDGKKVMATSRTPEFILHSHDILAVAEKLAVRFGLTEMWIDPIIGYLIDDHSLQVATKGAMLPKKMLDENGREQYFLKITKDTTLEDISYSWRGIAKTVGIPKRKIGTLKNFDRDSYIYRKHMEGLPNKEIATGTQKKFKLKEPMEAIHVHVVKERMRKILGVPKSKPIKGNK